MSNIQNILKIKGLTKHYNDFLALKKINIDIKAGELVTLLGPNGAGKSTLFSILSGMLSPDRGDCYISGKSIIHEPVLALKNLGIVFQQPTIDTELTVLDNLFFHARLHGIKIKKIKEYIFKELSSYNLEDKIHKKVKILSGGEKRKVELIRSLIHKPKVLLMDEPTVGLDPSSRKELLSKVHTLKNKDKLSILWTTHLVDEAEKADKVIVLNKGEILKIGTPSEIIKKMNVQSLERAFFKLIESEKNNDKK
jgi:ABC-2 type transport system ATP-binding protein